MVPYQPPGRSTMIEPERSTRKPTEWELIKNAIERKAAAAKEKAANTRKRLKTKRKKRKL